MTLGELEELRGHVLEQVREWEKLEGRIVMYRPSSDFCEPAGQEQINLPFAVMGSTTMDPAVGVVWPIRQYSW
jgi:hypothetical protein